MVNNLKTVLIFGLLMGLAVVIGGRFGGAGGMAISFGMMAVFSFGSYWFSDKVVLKAYRATEVSRETAPRLYTAVEELSQRAGLPMPKVYVIPGQAPNAFATGRNPSHAAVAATEGLVNMMSDEELRGVMAHELAHVKNRDTLISVIAATLAGMITMVARWGMFFGGGRDRNLVVDIAVMFLAPMAAMIIQMAISRTREFGADAGGAEIAGNPAGLASALRKLEAFAQGGRSDIQAGQATAHLFIVNPLRGKNGLAKLFSTHPPVEERVQRLMSLTPSM